MSDPAVAQSYAVELLAAQLRAMDPCLVVISPGSRSTPLVLACAKTLASKIVVAIDERSAGFLALGAARASGRIAVLICTSGSAGAHYYPAVVEASLAHHPLLVITADRPAELQQCAAAQTVDQTRLFGTMVRGFFDLGEATLSHVWLRSVRRTMQQAYALCTQQSGPAHINVPLRKPLEPTRATTAEQLDFAAEAARLATLPSASALATVTYIVPDSLRAALNQAKRGIIAVGNIHCFDLAAVNAIADLADRTGFTLVAEAGAQPLLWQRSVRCLDFVLSANVDELRPDLIIQFGSGGADLASIEWGNARLRWRNVPTAVIASTSSDPFVQASWIIAGSVAAAAKALTVATAIDDSKQRSSYREQWHQLARAFEVPVANALRDEPTSEAAFLAAIVGKLDNSAGVVIGNSLPIRLLELVPHPRRANWTITQRGCNGIDGMIAGAVGTALMAGPTLAIVGDVTFAHDIGSLQLLAAINVPLVIVVLDNSGGRIFDQLPAARLGVDEFERLFTTPPAFSLSQVAASFGIATTVADTPEAAARAVAAALGTSSAPQPSIVIARCNSNGANAFRTQVVTHARQSA